MILFFGGIETIMPFVFGPGVVLPMFKCGLGFSGECVVGRVEVERSGAPLVWNWLGRLQHMRVNRCINLVLNRTISYLGIGTSHAFVVLIRAYMCALRSKLI